MYVGVLPWAWFRGRRVYLLGQENAERRYGSHGQWSDFGGGVHDVNNIARSAAEELYEESMGVFGTVDELERELRFSPRAQRFTLPGAAGYLYLWQIRFDPNLVTVWNRIWQYIKRCTTDNDGKAVIRTCPEGFLEKQRIAWFPEHILFAAARGDTPGHVKFRMPFLKTLRDISEQVPGSQRRSMTVYN